MLDIIYNGGNSRFFDDAFFDGNRDVSIDLVSSAPDRIVLRNPATGVVTTITGTGLVLSGDGEPSGGTVTGLAFVEDGQTLSTWSGMSWSLVALNRALDELSQDAFFSPTFFGLFSQQDIVFDASDASEGFSTFAPGGGLPFEGGITSSDIRFVGSPFRDGFFGGEGDDTLVSNGGDDQFRGSAGTDVWDFTGKPLADFVEIDWGGWQRPLAVAVNAGADRFVMREAGGASFFTSLLGVDRVIGRDADGAFLQATPNADIFSITDLDGGYLEINPDRGNDTITVNGDGGGTLRLSFFTGVNAGIDANLALGRIVDPDGFTDTVAVTGADGVLELQGTDGDDRILGSDRAERFILRAGNDTLDGGGGVDLLRFDRGQISGGVTVDLAAGTARGVWDGEAFAHGVRNIEEVRGSRTGADAIAGSAAGERIEGGGGNDTLSGRGGDDRLEGQEGDDRIFGGDGSDRLDGGAGNDTIVSGEGSDDIDAGAGNDLIDLSDMTGGFGGFIRPGLGQDTVTGSRALWDAGEGHDISYRDLPEVGGVTFAVGANGTGTATSGDGRVNDRFSFAHYFIGTDEADRMQGGPDDRFQGWELGQGADTLDAGAGYDLLDYSYDGGDRGVTVNLATGRATDSFGDMDTFTGVEGVGGTDRADRLSGSAALDYAEFAGYGGNDTITGTAQSFDVLVYDREDDRSGTRGVVVDLAAGRATDAFGDTDTLSGIDGVRGTFRADVIRGGAGGERLEGGDGTDTLVGAGGDDTLIG
ncbi:calcium-binding protein, partial [Roseivivax isoporae]